MKAAVIMWAALLLACVRSAEVGGFAGTPPSDPAACAPTSAEICNQRDDDCDGAVDEDDACGDPCGAAQLSRDCALRTDGTIWCWTIADDGRVTLRQVDDGQGPFVQIAGACARRGDGSLWCHDGSASDVGIHHAIQGDTTRMERVKSLGFDVVQAAHHCGLRRDGAVWCWGAPLAPGDAGSPPVPTPVALPEPAVRVGSDSRMACAVLASGRVSCWGYGGEPASEPIGVPGLPPQDSVDVAVANGHACVLTAAGGVWCTGFNVYGQLCDGTIGDNPNFRRATELGDGVVTLAVEERDTCGMKADGAWCCGDGEPNPGGRPLARRLDLRGVTLRTPGTPCAITATGRVICRRFFVPPVGPDPATELEPVIFDLCGGAVSP
jgi:hypothetical protein